MRPWSVQDHSSSADFRHLRNVRYAVCMDLGYTAYLKDCPQRNVVFMHNSVRLVGSLCHSAARSAMAV